MLKIRICTVNYLNMYLLEPVGFKSPTLSSDFEGTRLRKSSKNAIVLLCQSQGYPVPEFRWDIHIKFWKLISLLYLLEHVGLKSPAFSAKSETYKFKMKSFADLNLLCDAQGYPIPTFRFEISLS